MRTARIEADDQHERAFYHCISRVVERRFALGQLTIRLSLGLRALAFYSALAWLIDPVRSRVTEPSTNERANGCRLFKKAGGCQILI